MPPDFSEEKGRIVTPTFREALSIWTKGGGAKPIRTGTGWYDYRFERPS